MEDHLPYSTAVLGIAFTAVNLLLTVLNYLLGRGTQLRNLAAKYKDRLYELNKLSLQYPEVAAAFQSAERTAALGQSPVAEPAPANQAAAQLAAAAAEKLAAQMHAYVRFRINFYEEIFYATQGWRMKALEDSKVWRDYIDSRLGHPLIQKALRTEPGIYGAAFVDYALET